MGERGVSGSQDATGLRIAVAVSRYNQEISDGLLASALDALRRMHAEDVTVCHVPGALELPLVAARLARTHDAVVCLGAVIKGDTAHFEHVAAQCAAGVARVALACGKPVAFGVLTTYDADQARARLDKGAEAAETAVEVASVLRQLDAEG